MEDEKEIIVIEAIIEAYNSGMQDFAIELLKMYGDAQGSDEVLSLMELKLIKV